jgi:hypothetical protein
MVAGVGVSDGEDRAQLMLIGAVALAFVILGFVTVYNTYLLDGPGSEPDLGIEDAAEYDRSVRHELRELTVRMNSDRAYASRSALDGAMERTTGNYSRLLAESYAAGGPVSAGLRYNGADAYGVRTVQNRSGPLVDDPVPAPNASTVGWFVLQLNTSELERSPAFEVRVDNGSAALTYAFSANRSSSGSMDVRVSGHRTASATCSPVGDQSLLDLVGGSSYTGSCALPGLRSLDGPLTVRFRNGGDVEGEYEIVTDDGTSAARAPNGSLPDCGPAATDGACTAPAVWTANVTTSYDSPTVSYRNTGNVTAYEVA